MQYVGLYSCYVLSKGYIRDNCLCTSRRPQCNAGNAYFTLHPVGGISAGFILLSRNSASDQFKSGAEYKCTYTIVAPPAMSVLIRINSINIPLASSSGAGVGGVIGGVIGGDGGGCRVAALQIYDGNSTSDVSKQLIGKSMSVAAAERFHDLIKCHLFK
jgi:hypothetical protein